ncbi:MAG: hypothetical protein J6Y07_03810 [Alphaproteobacteria bacterium]|nr:hypothetical protein [Alphaproteobacteria bacterium]
MNSFHKNLNRMAIFTAFVLCLCIIFYRTFFAIAIANIYLNGVIIGTTLFGIIVCFIKMFALLPEHRWLNEYTHGVKKPKLPPRLLRSVALLLHYQRNKLTAGGLRSVLDIIQIKMDDDGESVRYTVNTLVFLGLLGTFWGLLVTIGGFAELISNLNFNNETVLETMQAGLSQPLGGMATAFTSSLLGLGGSLVVGFLGLQLQLAHNAILHNLEEFLSARTNISHTNLVESALPQIESVLDRIHSHVENLDEKLELIE